jgi:hypothetical protein
MMETTICSFVRGSCHGLEGRMMHTNGSYHSRDCDWALPRDGVVELMLCVCVCVCVCVCRGSCERVRSGIA